MDGKTLNLNANELCVLEAIGKCSRGESAKGWYGSMQALADSLPFVFSKASAARVVIKLLELGLIIRREDNSLFLSQIETTASQNKTTLSQNETGLSQIETISAPLNNPPIKDNNIKKLTETTPCVHATEDKGVIFMNYSFNIFLKAFPFTPNWVFTEARKAELRNKWDNEYTPAKKHFIIQDLFAHEADNTRPDLRDPLTYCERFEVPAPTNYNGRAIPDGLKVFSAKYNGEWGMYTQEDIDNYHLTLPDN